MAKKINFKSKKTWKQILIIALSCLLLVGAIMGITALFRQREETTKTISPSYAIGGLTETGTYLDTEESIYTKDAFECDGMEIIPVFENNISYRVFYYNYNNEFLSSTEELTGKYSALRPELARYCRIVITPNDDQEIKWYEVNGYAKQLEISVYKEQKFELKNFFVADASREGYICADSGLGTEVTYNVSTGHGVTQPIDCTGIKSFIFVFNESNRDETFSYFYFTAQNLSIYSGRITDGGLEVIVEVPDGAQYLYVNYVLGKEFIINQYA